MHAVVNHLHLREPIADEVLARAGQDLTPAARAIDGFREFHVVRVSDDHLILVVLCDTPEAVERMATEVGSPWIVEHVAPHLAGPPERHVGAVVGSSET